jgi:tetratricopeptide (TPR) repeat protein
MQERTQYQQELIEIANSLEVADKLYGAGQFAEAAQIYKLAYTSLTRAVGQLDPDTIACLEKLADSYFSAERFGEALPHYKSLLSAGEQILGAAHPDVVAMAAKVSDIADMVDAPPGQAMPALKEGAARLTWSSIAALRPEDIQPTDWTSDWRLQQRIEDNSVFFDFASLNAEKRGTKPIPLPPAVPIHVDRRTRHFETESRPSWAHQESKQVRRA